MTYHDTEVFEMVGHEIPPYHLWHIEGEVITVVRSTVWFICSFEGTHRT